MQLIGALFPLTDLADQVVTTPNFWQIRQHIHQLISHDLAFDQLDHCLPESPHQAELARTICSVRYCLRS